MNDLNTVNTNINPLRTLQGLPKFTQIKADDFLPAINAILEENRAQINSLLTTQRTFTWDNLMSPIEQLTDQLARAWGLAGHLCAVVNTEELRAAYNACIPLVSDYFTEMGQNEPLYQAILSIRESTEFSKLSVAKQKVIDNELRDFRLAGVHLPPAQKERYREIQQQLAHTTHQFEENVLDATNAFEKQITDEKILIGIPEQARLQMAQAAAQKNLSGWLITLSPPIYQAIMTYAEQQSLRAEIYYASNTRASDLGENPKWDNTNVMDNILQLRHELAILLGFENYAQLSLATKMAKTCAEVNEFLSHLGLRSKKAAEHEFQELKQYAKEYDGTQELMPWDISYYSEKLRQHEYALSQEELRPYFPETKVVPGLFSLLNRLYGITFEEIIPANAWHQDVRLFMVKDQQQNLCGHLYVDLYARPQKRSGAWVDEYVGRRILNDNKIQTPVAYVVCNFSNPVGSQPALFDHEEVLTLFHEFGHAMHHILTKVDAAFVSGTAGVAWDAVELPSQFMENWTYEKEVLNLISGHYQTQEPLPDTMINKLKKAKNFQSGLYMLRQIIYSVFDFQMHEQYNIGKTNFIQELLNRVRSEFAVDPIAPFNRFQHSFGHIFAGGYAAGYYSYKWAEVLSADAYARFEEEGLFNPKVGADFLHSILEQGGAREPKELFVAFRGREPTIDALLKHNGLI